MQFSSVLPDVTDEATCRLTMLANAGLARSQAPSTSLLELGMMLKAVLFEVGPMRADLQLDGVVLV